MVGGASMIGRIAQGNNLGAAQLLTSRPAGGTRIVNADVHNELEQRMAARLRGGQQQAAPPQEQAASQQQASQEQLPDAAHGKGEGPYGKMVSLAQKLHSSEKGGLGSQNSDKFNAVSQGISQVLGMLSTPLTGDTDRDREVFAQMTLAYGGLIAACDDYCSRKVRTDAGRARQAIVGEIRRQAEADFAGIRSYGDKLPSLAPAQRAGTMLEAFADARQRTLQLKAGKEEDLKHVGGAISHIGVLEKGSLTDENASGFFKESDVYTKGHYTNWGEDLTEQENMSLWTKFKSRSQVSDKVNDIALRAFRENKRLVQMPEYMTDPEFRRVANTFDDKAVQGYKESYNQISLNLGVNMEEGESLNISNRNVATSRIANLLGIGDLVAQSETAELRDAEGGGVKKGNLMQKARGTEANTFVQNAIREEIRQVYGTDQETSYQHTKFDDKVTPEFMKSLSSLQVLDTLVGQIDRHNKNYMIEELDEGKMGRVQGIDNDFAFGKTSIIPENEKVLSFGSHSRSILDGKGKMHIAHMDEALAQRLLQLQPEAVKLEMADLIEPWAVDALLERLKGMQDAIRADKEENPDSGRYLTDDSQWDAKALEDFWKKDTGADLHTSYLTEFLGNANSPATGNGTLPKTFVIDEMDDEKGRELGASLWKDLQAIPDLEGRRALLKERGVNNKEMLDYVEQSGLLMGKEDFTGGEEVGKLRKDLVFKWKKAQAAKK